MKPGVKLKAQIRAELKSVIVVPRSAVVKKDSDFVVYVRKSPGTVRTREGQTRTGRPDPGGRDRRASSRQTLALNPDVKRESKDEGKKLNKPGAIACNGIGRPFRAPD